jgi:hypothetical protein
MARRLIASDVPVGTPLSGYDAPSPPLDQNLSLTLAGYGVN